MDEEFKCAYPTKCKKEGKYKQLFKLINEEDANVELLFCDYHLHIVMGGHFKAKLIKSEDKPEETNFELVGPLKEVEIAEQVFAAIDVVKKTKK